MKITKPGADQPAAAVDAPESTAAAQVASKGASKDASEVAFKDASEVFEAKRAEAARGAAVAGPAVPPSLADVAAALQHGRLTPAAAVDVVIGRVLDAQVGAQAAPAVRQKVEAALREALESDPLLAEKLRALVGRP